MSSSLGRCDFDRGKVFYPLVLQYIVSLVGFTELTAHGMMRRVRKFAQEHDITIKQAVDRLRQRGAHLPESAAEWTDRVEVLPELSLVSVTHKPLSFEFDMIADELAANATYIIDRSWSQAALSLLISAHERCKAMRYKTTDPMWEFLRHCRNAAAHGNRFNFHRKEPKLPAEWSGLEITRSLQGLKLFLEEPSDTPFLKPADPIRLLWDLEQAFPNMPA